MDGAAHPIRHWAGGSRSEVASKIGGVQQGLLLSVLNDQHLLTDLIGQVSHLRDRRQGQGRERQVGSGRLTSGRRGRFGDCPVGSKE